MKNKNIRNFIFGLITGLIIWFLIDLIWDWEGNVNDYNKGYNDAMKFWTEKNK